MRLKRSGEGVGGGRDGWGQGQKADQAAIMTPVRPLPPLPTFGRRQSREHCMCARAGEYLRVKGGAQRNPTRTLSFVYSQAQAHRSKTYLGIQAWSVYADMRALVHAHTETRERKHV